MEERVEALESALAEDSRSATMSGSGSLLPRDQLTEDRLGSSLSPQLSTVSCEESGACHVADPVAGQSSLAAGPSSSAG